MRHENGPGANRTNDESNLSHLHDFMDLDHEEKSEPSYVVKPNLLGPGQSYNLSFTGEPI